MDKSFFSIFILLFSSYVQATAILAWEFKEPSKIIGNTEEIFLHATLMNSASSSDAVLFSADGTTIIGSQYDGLQIEEGINYGTFGLEYDFFFGSPLDPEQFFHVDLANVLLNPGDSVDYRFGLFRPIGGYVPDGIYQINFAEMLIGENGQYEELGPLNTFRRTVVSVAEPPLIWLLILGLIILIQTNSSNLQLVLDLTRKFSRFSKLRG